MYKKTLLLLLVFGSLLVSCSQNELNLASERSVTDALTVANRELAENSSNPYDYFGKAHYDGILYICKKTNDYQGTRAQRSAALDEFLQSQPSHVTRGVTESSLSDEELMKVFQQSKEGRILVDSANTSREMTSALGRYSQLLRNLYAAESFITYAALKDSVVAFENVILKNGQLTPFEKERLLKSTSTLRYSALQWEGYVQDVLAPRATRGWKIFRWLRIAGADAIGVFAEIIPSIKNAVEASDLAKWLIDSDRPEDIDLDNGTIDEQL